MKVELYLPPGLYKVMQVDALLCDESVEQACVARLKEVMESALDADGFMDTLQKTLKEEEVTHA